MTNGSDASVPTRSLVGVEAEVEVGAVAHGGHCVARLDGRVVFVRHALPGERARVRVTEGDTESRFLRADAIEVVTPAAGRVSPPCPYAGPGRCGGCDWQHADLGTQRALKKAVIVEAFARFAKLAVDVEVETVHGDQDGLDWRTRMRYAVAADGAAGLRRHRSHEIVEIDRCLIAHPLVESTEVLARFWPGFEAVEAAASVSSGERAVVVWEGDASALVPPLETGITLTRSHGRTRSARPAHLTEEAAGRRFFVRADGFWQVHPGAADALVSAVLDFLQPRAGERALDLYSGVGLFAAAIAERVGTSGSVLAVEGDVGATSCARQNLADLSNTRVRQGSVDAVLREGAARRVDLVVLDPPREGAGRAVMSAITRREPRAIAYVACDPVALARDIAYARKEGFQLTGLRAYDCFPMTQHVECVALLVRGSPRSRPIQ